MGGNHSHVRIVWVWIGSQLELGAFIPLLWPGVNLCPEELLLERVFRALSSNDSQIANQRRTSINVPCIMSTRKAMTIYKEVLKIAALGKRLTQESNGDRQGCI